MVKKLQELVRIQMITLEGGHEILCLVDENKVQKVRSLQKQYEKIEEEINYPSSDNPRLRRLANRVRELIPHRKIDSPGDLNPVDKLTFSARYEITTPKGSVFPNCRLIREIENTEISYAAMCPEYSADVNIYFQTEDPAVRIKVVKGLKLQKLNHKRVKQPY